MPDNQRARVPSGLVQLIEGFQPFGGGPHFSGGTIGLAPIVRALMDGGRDDVIWRVLQEDTQPSYGFFTANWSSIQGSSGTSPMSKAATGRRTARPHPNGR
ncbi:hypothetical protein AB0O67_32315 [Streptomyces sp. NPDC086077]|uniref:hypothetical protein n=1 Tax=Streptomyces sp. NPDC086077 TaxID=3154862 RepID=UPI00343CD44D